MPNKTIVRTYTEDKADGAVTTYSEQIEEKESSGILEASLGLIVLTACLLTVLFSWVLVSSIVKNQRGEMPKQAANEVIQQLGHTPSTSK